MITLEVSDLVVIASRTLKLDTDRILDLFDLAAADRALAQAPAAAESADPAAQSAALLHALVRERPLRRGNQQVAFAAMLQFLALNGWDMDPDPPGPVAALVADLASGTLDARYVANRLAARLRPSDRVATTVTEAPMPSRPALLLTRTIRKAARRTRRQGIFHRFTDRARRVVVLAQHEARAMGHNYIGTEHLLLGLLHEGQGVAAKVLESLGVSLEETRIRVEEIIGRGQGTHPGHIPFTPRAKKVVDLSLREALRLGHNYVGTEHLLLSLVREGEGVAAQILAADLTSDYADGYAEVRERVLAVLTEVCEQADPSTRLVRLAVPSDVAAAAEQLVQVRRQQKDAFDTGDLDRAATLRDRERQLRADKLRLEQQWNAGLDVQAVIAENQRVHRELDRLRTLLRQHGIEPDTGTARTA